MSGLETILVSLRETGLPLVLIWLLTLSIVYGILSHVEIPRSMSARGVIAIVASFLVLLATAATPMTGFITNLVIASIMIAFGLLVTMIFLEIAGAKVGDKHIFGAHPRIFGVAILVLAVLIFIGAGGLGIINIPNLPTITTPMVALLFFLAVMGTAVWVLFKSTK